MAQTTNGLPQVEPHDSLYTSLLVISAVTLFIGIIFIVARSYEFFGSVWPRGTAN